VVLFSISDSIDQGFNVFFAWLPHVLAFIAILLIGWIIARVIGKLVARVTNKAGLDRTVHNGTGGDFLKRVVPRPSHLVGRIVFWALFLSAISLAVAVLGVAALTAFVGAVWAYLPNVLAAVPDQGNGEGATTPPCTSGPGDGTGWVRPSRRGLRACQPVP
jgi:hypothetical protein